jgi:hypothetical protein
MFSESDLQRKSVQYRQELLAGRRPLAGKGYAKKDQETCLPQ